MQSMKKRLLAGLMTVMIIMSSVMPVFAVSGDQAQYFMADTQSVMEGNTVEPVAVYTAPNELHNRNVRFYAFVDDELTLIQDRENVTTYWIDGRQCIDTATLVDVYGKLGFKAADLTAGGKLFLHTDFNDASIWAEAAKIVDGVVYAAAINHDGTGAAGAPGDKFDLFYLPKHTVDGKVGRTDVKTIAAETFYTVSDAGNKQYFLNGSTAVIEKDASTQNWTCTDKDGNKVAGVVQNGKVTFTIPSIAQPYTMSATDKPVPQPVVLTAKVNGNEFSGASLSDVITQSGVETKKVTSLEFVSGKLTKADRDYIEANLKWMKEMTLNVSSTMQLLDDNGVSTTILGKDTASLKFGTPSGWSRGGLKTLTLSGITEVQNGAITSDSAETINLPDVVTVGDSSLGGFKWLNTLYLPKAKTIGKFAFLYNQELRHLTLNAVETLGDGSFKFTDNLTKLTLPETIKTIGAIDFGSVRQGNKSGTLITMKAITPPTTARGAFSGVSNGSVLVPQGSLQTYVDSIDGSTVDLNVAITKTRWNDLSLREEGSHTIEFYNNAESWNTKYAYVKDGETVKASQIPTTTIPAGKEFLGWNTAKNGNGVWVDEQMKPSELPRYPSEPGSRYPYSQKIQVYPIFGIPGSIVAKVNGTEVDGASLRNLIARSGVEAKNVNSLEFVSGKLTKADRDYIKENLKWMKEMTLNVSSAMQLLDHKGQSTTVLGKDTASLEFGTPDGWSKGALCTLTLGGITEVQQGAIKSNSVETINLPDVVTVGDSSLGYFAWLKTLYLPKAKTVGKFAFSEDVQLQNLTLNAVETLGDDSFKYTDSLKKLTLPETIKTIGDIKFGIVHSGNKRGTVITMKAVTPPTVNRNAFNGVSSIPDQLDKQSVVIVPQGALEAYMHQARPNADVTKVLSRYDVQWNGLYLREEGSHTIMYYYPDQTYNNQYAYVKDGNAVTEAQIPVVKEKDTELFLGWNMKKDGTGDKLTAGFVPTGEVTAYPILVPAVTITVNLGDSTQTIKVEKDKAIGEKLPVGPVKDEDHGFAGWLDEKGNKITAETVAKNDITIHPTWFEDFNHNDIDDSTEPHYTVIYTDAGLHPGNPVFEAKVFEDILTGMPTPVFGENPVRKGEVFAGWEPAVSETVTGDAVYTAVWKEDRNNNGIADDEDTYHEVVFTDGANGEVFEDVHFDVLTGTKLPAFGTDPEREGYVFKGWKDQNGNVVTSDTVVNEGLTISAVFEKEETPEKPVEPTAPSVPAEPAEPTVPTQPAKPDTPATGDTSNVMVWMLLAVCAAMGSALVLKKRRECK